MGHRGPLSVVESDAELVDEMLRAAHAEVARFVTSELRPLEQAFQHLEQRHDWESDQQREALRPQLACAYARRDQLMNKLEVVEDLVPGLRELMIMFIRMTTSLEEQFETITTMADVPEADTFVRFYAAARERERMRLCLWDITRAAPYGRGWDAVGQLRSHWVDIHTERMALFSRLVAPGVKRPRGDALLETKTRAVSQRMAQLHALQREETTNGHNGNGRR